jgi:hypothetical protein
MTDIGFEALMWARMVEAVIVPLRSANVARGVTHTFEGLTAEEARVLKRKFRKLWRRFRRLNRGLETGRPTQYDMLDRKNAVYRLFFKEVWPRVRAAATGEPF